MADVWGTLRAAVPEETTRLAAVLKNPPLVIDAGPDARWEQAPPELVARFMGLPADDCDPPLVVDAPPG
jgi:hypothetical protein